MCVAIVHHWLSLRCLFVVSCAFFVFVFLVCSFVVRLFVLFVCSCVRLLFVRVVRVCCLFVGAFIGICRSQALTSTPGFRASSKPCVYTLFHAAIVERSSK